MASEQAPSPAEDRHAPAWASRLENTASVLLALATVLSAWCAYQSTLWDGNMMQLYNQSAWTRTQAATTLASALQIRATEVGIFVQFAAAHSEGNKHLETFLYQRFRPEMRKAVDAWLKTDPLSNPKAPETPFDVPGYALPEENNALQLGSDADKMAKQANQANRISDRYVLLTVMFSIVLFLGGTSNRFERIGPRMVFGTVALVLFIAATIGAFVLPKG